jgi:hypothetical protein
MLFLWNLGGPSLKLISAEKFTFFCILKKFLGGRLAMLDLRFSQQWLLE